MKLEEYVSPDELRRLLASLVVFLGAAGLFLVFGFTVVPGIRNANRPLVLPGVEPVVRQTGWLDPAEFAPQRAREIPPLDPKTVLDPSPELLARGKEIYGQKCAQCHGREGRGDGPSAGALNPPPRDFSRPEGWKLGRGRPSIYKVLTEGIEGSSMAAYDTLRPRDRMALVHTVRSFSKPPPPPEEDGELDEFAKTLAKAPARIPNRVPVSLAMRKLAAEFASPPPIRLPGPDEDDAGAQALRIAVVDAAQAALTLQGSPGWRETDGALARTVAAGLPSNGFSTRAVSFGPGEWQALREELIRRWGR